MHAELLDKPRDDLTSVLKTLPGKLDIKRHDPGILFLLGLPTFYMEMSS